MSGYEIQRWISQGISFFWAESFGQIYPELRRLAKSRWIVPSQTKAGTARNRQAFRITPAGKNALRAWLEQAASPERFRIEYLLKLFFGRDAGVDINLKHIDDVAKRYSERLTTFAQLRDLVIGENSTDDDLVYWLIVLRHGQMTSAARCQWAQDSVALIEAQQRGGNRAMLALFKKLERRES